MEDSDSDNEFNHLFTMIDSDDELFSFEQIEILPAKDNGFDVYSHILQQPIELSSGFMIIFQFGYNSKEYFTSKVLIEKINYPCFSTYEQQLAFHRIVFSIGMTTLPWFWMGFATKKIILSENIMCFCQLTSEMLSYWQEIYDNILSEFMFLHPHLQFHFVKLIPEIECNQVKQGNWFVKSNFPENKIVEMKEQYVIVPLGGGKDSLVVWNNIQQQGKIPILLYVADGFAEYESNWRLQAIVHESKSTCYLIKHDFRDPHFIDLCKSSCDPNGHPWAALVLFDGLLLASLLHIPTIALGHEKSANEGNRVYIDTLEVNHQYDKSQIFLQLTKTYIFTCIDSLSLQSQPFEAYSALGELWELEIAKSFALDPSLQRFHSLFLSCNEPIEETNWCLHCPKCAFISLILAAWMTPSQLAKTCFQGRNMFDDMTTLSLFVELFNEHGQKPFDCVGTSSEARSALALIYWHDLKQRITSNESLNLEINPETNLNNPQETIPQNTSKGILPLLFTLTHLYEIPLTTWLQFTKEEDIIHYFLQD